MKYNSQYLTFLYHEATDNPSESGFQRNSALPYKHKGEEFYSNINTIIKTRKNIITVDKLNIHNNATLLTFDDGGKSALLIAEYLEKHKKPNNTLHWFYGKKIESQRKENQFSSHHFFRKLYQ